MLFHHGQISTDPLCSRIRRLVSKDLKLEQDSQVWGFKREVFSNRHFPGELEGKVSALEQIEKRQQLNQLLQVSNDIFSLEPFINYEPWNGEIARFSTSHLEFPQSWLVLRRWTSRCKIWFLISSGYKQCDANDDVFGSWFLPVFQGKDGWQCCFE